MLKTYLPLVFVVIFLNNINAQKTYVPDDNFEQALIDLNIDKDGVVNDSVATADISNKISLNVKNKNIADLTGIEDFTNLQDLRCGNNQLSNLDVSKNVLLDLLYCSYNKLTNIDLSKNKKLSLLKCANNKLTSLDLKDNEVLEWLDCGMNEFSSLDLSNNFSLTHLRIESWNNTTLFDIEFGQINNLQDISFRGIGITSLNVSNFPSLIQVKVCCSNLQSIDLSNDNLLEYLYLESDELTSLDVQTNTALKVVDCLKNQLQMLDLSKNILLETVKCNENKLTDLNLKNGNNTKITYMNALDNPLQCVQVDNETDAKKGASPYEIYKWKIGNDLSIYSENCSAFLGVDDEELAGGLRVYPNPVTNTLSIDSKLPVSRLDIYSILGRKVKEVRSGFDHISTDDLAEGIYILRIFSEKGVTVKKLIKQ